MDGVFRAVAEAGFRVFHGDELPKNPVAVKVGMDMDDELPKNCERFFADSTRRALLCHESR